MSSSGELILLYTTGALNKSSYRRGILDALCYPNGHVILYSYRKQQIDPDLLECSCRLDGKKGLIIFVDMDEQKNITYFPLRFVTIHRLKNTRASISSAPGRERIYLPLRLENLIEYKPSQSKDQWHATVSKFDTLRKIAAKPTYFVVKGTDNFTTPSHSIRTAWEDLVSIVSQSWGFRDAVFLRLDHIETHASGSTQVDLEREDERLIYKLRPGKIYRLDLSVFEQPGTRSETRISVATSATELLTVDQPFQSIVSGLVEKSAFIACKRTIDNTLATISVTIGEDLKRASKGVQEPSPVLFVRISVPWITLVAFLLFVFVGSFLVSADSYIAKELFGESHYLVWIWLSKFLGAAFLTYAAFLAFRRLPSGSSAK